MNLGNGKMARLRKGRPRPPEKISVSILRSDHDYLADAVQGTDKPLCDIIHSKLVTESVIKEEYNEKIDYYEKQLNETLDTLKIYREFVQFKELVDQVHEFALNKNSLINK